MYKSKLQELCQRRSWSLPEYKTHREEGPAHNPRFSSTVTVNSIPFRSTSPSPTAKKSQDSVAMLAFHHFSQPKPNPIILVPSIPNLSSFPQPSLCAPSTSSSSTGSPGHSPDVDNILSTNRVLQPNLEAACQTSQFSSPVSTVKDITKVQDQKGMLRVYKNQLQSYAQKRNLNLPVYSSEWEGPPHAIRFKCKVTIDGQTFENPKFYSALKDAEHAAAEIALMSLSSSGVQEDNTGLYKNLLQALVQKEGFRLPVYNTNKSGEAHIPIFVSQVVVEGELFTGQEAKTKKQAEMSAAKVAYTTLKERKAHQGLAPEFSPNFSEANVITGLQHHSNGKSPVSPGLVIRNQPNKDKVHQGLAPEFSPNFSEANVITGLQHHSNGKSPVSPGLVIGNQPNKDKGDSDQSSLFPLSAQQGQASYLTSDHSESNVRTDLQHNSEPKSLVRLGLVTCNHPNKDKQNMFSQSLKELMRVRHQAQEVDLTSQPAQSASQPLPTQAPLLTPTPASQVASLIGAPTKPSSSRKTRGQKRLTSPTEKKGKKKNRRWESLGPNVDCTKFIAKWNSTFLPQCDLIDTTFYTDEDKEHLKNHDIEQILDVGVWRLLQDVSVLRHLRAHLLPTVQEAHNHYKATLGSFLEAKAEVVKAAKTVEVEETNNKELQAALAAIEAKVNEIETGAKEAEARAKDAKREVAKLIAIKAKLEGRVAKLEKKLQAHNTRLF